MKLWSLQPKEIAEGLLRGEAYVCKPELSGLYEEDCFKFAYGWLVEAMQKTIPKPEHVTIPAWAWHTHNGVNTKPDRRTYMFRRSYYADDEVILELEVPDSEVLLTDFDLWHSVLNNIEIISDEEYYADEDRVYTAEEKAATWQQIFEVKDVEFVQACLWEIKPEHVVRIHKPRRKKA